MTDPSWTRGLVLVVEDERPIADLVRLYLSRDGFGVHVEHDGTEVCRRLRRTSNIPVIFLSSRDDEIDRIVGLELGADDYVTKPFSLRELSARIRALFRRSEQPVPVDGSSSSLVDLGRVQVDLAGHRLLRDGDGRCRSFTEIFAEQPKGA